jgi:FixJ family two-component response regulator
LLGHPGSFKLHSEIRLSAEPGKTVAVVDDDDAVRIAIAGLIRALGWKIAQFNSGLTYLQSEIHAETSCLITDVRMPNINGVELHEKLLAQGLVVPTIFITAFPTPYLNAKLNAPGVVAIFEKPIDPNAMADCIGRVLGVA